MPGLTPYTWMNGDIVPWDQSTLHVNTDCVLRGANVFEGVRGYVSSDGRDVRLFRLPDHLRRLFSTSMRVLRMNIPYTAEDLTQAIIQLMQKNELHADTHIRIVVYFGEGLEGSFAAPDIFTGCFILTLPRPQLQTLKSGISCCVSPWRRISDNAMPPRVKAGANYLNSRLATMDARLKGFDLAILLNDHGKVAEGPGQCVFLVRDGRVITPRVSDGILEGVTRDTVLLLAGQLGIAVEEREVDASELYVADEVFFAGTAAEIQPIRDVDRYVVGSGSVGLVTERLQTAYADLVRGRAPESDRWLTPVYGRLSGVA